MEEKVNSIENFDNLSIKELAILSAKLTDLDMQIDDIMSEIDEEEVV